MKKEELKRPVKEIITELKEKAKGYSVVLNYDKTVLCVIGHLDDEKETTEMFEDAWREQGYEFKNFKTEEEMQNFVEDVHQDWLWEKWDLLLELGIIRELRKLSELQR